MSPSQRMGHVHDYMLTLLVQDRCKAGIHANLHGLRIGRAAPRSFNVLEQIFAPKGEGENDSPQLGAARAPESVRPLALKNTDNKAVAGVANSKVRIPLSKRIIPIQRGFTAGRQLAIVHDRSDSIK